MTKLIKSLFILLQLVVLLAVTFSSPIDCMAAQGPVELNSASDFAVLAGSGITSTGLTTINGNGLGMGGDVGTYPTATIVGFPPATITDGTLHYADTVTITAKDDLAIAYNDAASRMEDIQIITTALGAGQTLQPGTYKSDSSIQINGDLTLDALGDPFAMFIFQAGSTLTTEVGSRIILAGGARYDRIIWQVGSSATLGTSSVFVGQILALTSISLSDGVDVTGRLLAINGAVTLINDTIRNPVKYNCDIVLTKSILQPSDIDQQFFFEMSDSLGNTFYASLIVEAGDTSVSQEIVRLPPDTYTVKEMDNNWRYEVVASSTFASNGTETYDYSLVSDSLSMPLTDPYNTDYNFVFTNIFDNDQWKSKSDHIVNIMVKPT